MKNEGFTHHTQQIGETALHWAEIGSGPVVLLLHGFPDLWRGWRRQMPVLAEAGYRAIAVDLRGYGGSARPHGIGAYAMPRLVGDVVALFDHLGVDRAHLAGHDWGGVIAWYTAMHHPERIRRLVIANAPHPAAFRREMRRGGQALRSWYAGFFQLPGLPEWVLRRRGFRALERIYRESPQRPGAFSEEDIREYLAAAAQPGALTAMLNYYRAALRRPGLQVRPIASPTLLIWGERDRALSPRLTEGLERWVGDLRLERIPDASHWVLADAPDCVNGTMIDFLDAE